MKLIASLTSPYVRKVASCWPKRRSTAIWSSIRPGSGKQGGDAESLGKVPVLVLDDDSTLYDSRVIAEYLDTVARTIA
jgi:glutathione S-transferase